MNMALPVARQLLKFCLFGFALAVQGYSDNNVSPSPLLLSGVPSIKGIPNLAHEPSSATGSPSQPDGSHLPLGPLPFKLSPLPDTIEAHAPAWSPTAFMEFSPSNISPPPVAAEGHLPVSPPSSAVASPPPLYAPPPLFSEENVPSTPSAPKEGDPVNKSPVSEPMIPAPISSPSWNLSQTPPSFHLTQAPSLLPTSPTQVQPDSKPPSTVTITPGPVSSTSRNLPQTLPPFHSTQTPSLSPASPALVEPDGKPPSAVPITAGPVSSPSRNLPQISPLAHPSPGGIPFHNSPQNAPAVPEENPSVMPPTTLATPLENPPQSSPAGVQTSLPPYTNNGNVSNNEPPTLEPINPVAAPLRNSRLSNSQHDNSPVHSNGLHSFSPRANGRNPPGSRPPISVPTAPAPVVSPMGKFPDSSHISPPHTAGAASSPSSAPSPSKQQDRASVLPPANETHQPFPSIIHSPEKSPATAEAPSTHQATRHSNNAAAPHSSSHASHPYKKYHTPAMSPAISSHPGEQNRTSSTAPVAGNLVSHPPPQEQGEIGSPSVPPSRRKRYTAPPPLNPGSSSPYHLPIQTPAKHFAPSPSPSVVTSRQTNTHLISPKVSPPESSSTIPQVPLLPSIQWFPPPPPNEGCTATTCTEPYTNTLPGSPCGCVWPMQVGLRLSVALYTFFPLVSELAAEVASGVFMKRSQVRIMGANAASDQLDKTIVLIDLVPIGNKFDMPTAFSTYQRFWHKQVSINGSLFGDYDVLYVHYPGLPPSPPLPPSIGIIDNGPYSSENNPIKPLGVDVQKRLHKHGLSRGMIAIVVLSAAVALALFSAIALIFLLRYRDGASQPASTPRGSLQALAKPSGSPGSMHASGLSSASLSFGSSVIAYNGSAKTFSAAEIERATNSFDASGVLGEGGFGRVYCGILENGTKVAIKVLKRDDQQGSREFLAEVEMLTRLHHRNLVKLIGICTEDHLRCLVYELIPNGSVESHLHGVDKESAPLDWDARVKIALGAARGLAYLHEDSSPHVIHRDFKASNILLEHDFTPKVSDFGLARTAMDEEGHHISTRVVGTFGYVAPEYAMTGHLLVKSDVYSYGVVLLELLTGRKPVDMSQPPGQENLVAWASPLLTNREGLEAIIDPSLGPEVPFDTVAKVAAIASMCVQLEVSHRPFMGEVVQALKLVSNECDEAKEFGSRSSGADDSSIDLDARASGRLDDPLQSLYPVPHYGSDVDEERGVSVSARFDRDLSGSFRRHSSSGPVRTEQSRRLWQKITRSMRGSVSEHGFMFRFWPSSR